MADFSFQRHRLLAENCHWDWCYHDTQYRWVGILGRAALKKTVRPKNRKRQTEYREDSEARSAFENAVRNRFPRAPILAPQQEIRCFRASQIFPCTPETSRRAVQSLSNPQTHGT